MLRSRFNPLQLAKCREKVEKALSAGDPSKCGYISLNYLKIVLDSFVYRLPRRIFIPLMKRYESLLPGRLFPHTSAGHEGRRASLSSY